MGGLLRDAYKIELYDAGIVLEADTEEKFEHTGWDYSERSMAYTLTGRFLSLLEGVGVITRDKNIEIEDDVTERPLFYQEMSRHILCSKLVAKALSSGRLKIHAHCYIISKPEDVWYVESTYRGSYSVFWGDELREE